MAADNIAETDAVPSFQQPRQLIKQLPPCWKGRQLSTSMLVVGKRVQIGTPREELFGSAKHAIIAEGRFGLKTGAVALVALLALWVLKGSAATLGDLRECFPGFRKPSNPTKGVGWGGGQFKHTNKSLF